MTCISNVAPTGTKWIQCILEVIFELKFMKVTISKVTISKVTSPSRNLVKYLIPFRLWQLNMLFAVRLINFKTFFLKILRSILNFKVQFIPFNDD